MVLRKSRHPRRGAKVVVAMSGGVDSSVAALVLKKAGYDCIGISFKTWPKEECGGDFGRACCSLEAIGRARLVAERLAMPFYVIDAYGRFKRDVIDYFAAEYQRGRTPNPCILCNEKIKFGLLLEKAKALGADHVATGHFAKVERRGRAGRFFLREGADKEKDQSYFLFSLTQDQLAHALFPVGGMTKDAVRRYAKRAKLAAFNAASSQDICFVHDGHYGEYLRKQGCRVSEGGDIVDLSGKVIGRHKGISCYTIGQRRGLRVAHPEPLYVVRLDVKANRVVVGPKASVMRRSLTAEGLNWVAVDGIDAPVRVKTKIRYNHRKAPALVTPVGHGRVRVDFDEPQEAPAPGQAIVFYDRDTVVGGGWIE